MEEKVVKKVDYKVKVAKRVGYLVVKRVGQLVGEEEQMVVKRVDY